jgi:hypothetical protein
MNLLPRKFGFGWFTGYTFRVCLQSGTVAALRQGTSLSQIVMQLRRFMRPQRGEINGPGVTERRRGRTADEVKSDLKDQPS